MTASLVRKRLRNMQSDTLPDKLEMITYEMSIIFFPDRGPWQYQTEWLRTFRSMKLSNGRVLQQLDKNISPILVIGDVI